MSHVTNGAYKDANGSSHNRLLVICVDRDNDVGDKAGISTPAVGRDACISAAQRLALEDPEDADPNTIFAAVKTYDNLVSSGYEAQVITVAGVARRGVDADQKVAKEIKSVLREFAADGAVVVSDGEDDESVIPSIQAILPVISVQRVVMRVSRSVEYSYAVFGRYLKKIAYDPKYSKFFLGVPGILLLIAGIGTLMGYTAEIIAILASILGGAFIVRAFDVDKAWTHWTKPTPAGFMRLFSLVAGIVIILSSIPAGVAQVSIPEEISDAWIINAVTNQTIVGQFMSGSFPMIWIGLGAIFAGMLLSNWMGGNKRQHIDILRLIVLCSLYPTVAQFVSILLHDESSFTLVPPLLMGLAVTLVSATLLFRKFKKSKRRPKAEDAGG